MLIGTSFLFAELFYLLTLPHEWSPHIAPKHRLLQVRTFPRKVATIHGPESVAFQPLTAICQAKIPLVVQASGFPPGTPDFFKVPSSPTKLSPDRRSPIPLACARGNARSSQGFPFGQYSSQRTRKVARLVPEGRLL